MKRLTFCLLLALLLLAAWAPALRGQDVCLQVNPDKMLNRIDEKVYGHFLEHIYHSVNGGLWGELIWNRSFEEWAGGGQWLIQGDSLVQRGSEPNTTLLFGEKSWTDYELSCQARKTGGDEGFLILVRAGDDKSHYWANLGGWGDTRSAVERTIKNKRAGGSKSVPVVIEKDRWYDIRVRCEGPRIQVFLDGQVVIDYTDPQPLLAGRAGVGTWGTQAAFRNIKVAALDGKVLYEGLPRLGKGAAGVSLKWEPYGSGLFDRVTGTGGTPVVQDPLNSESCQLIGVQAGEAGVQQKPLCIRKGETYVGSLWARRRSGGGQLVVRLLDGQAKLAEQTLGEPGAEWKEFPFSLSAANDAPDATIQVGLSGACEVLLDQVSLMPKSWKDAGGFRPDLLKAVADLRPPAIRWPGGCYASLYRWKDGVGPQHKRVKYPRTMWDDIDVNSFGTDEFVAMSRKVGAQPLIVVNIGMHMPRGQRDAYCREACDWIEYCNGPADSTWGKVRAANGHPEPYGVKFWEIDNEVWKLTPEDYVSVVRQFAPAMKKVDPSITLLACGSGQLGRNWGPGDQAVITGAGDLVDYLSVHHYEGADKYAAGPAAAEKFWRSLADKIAQSKKPKLKLYVSEWNAQSTDWRTGLYAGGALNVFERCGAFVGLAGPALFLRHVSARAWDNAFINFDHKSWFPAPNYVVTKLWRDHYQPCRVELTGQPSPHRATMASDSSGQTDLAAAGRLDAIATRSEDGKTLVFKAVNPTDKEVQVELKIADSFPVGSAAAKIVSADSLSARNSLAQPDAIKPVDAAARVQGQSVKVTLPKLSAAAVSIRRG